MAAPSPFTEFFERAEQTRLLRKAPDQRVDADTLARARSRELSEILERRDFESAVMLRGKWLPGIEGAPGEAYGLQRGGPGTSAPRRTAVTHHVRTEHLRRADKRCCPPSATGCWRIRRPHLAICRRRCEAWKAYTRELLVAAQHNAALELPNPFRAGQPLRPDQGRAVFRGREALVARIEAILADADQSSSLALLGPRRCGKTSLLADAAGHTAGLRLCFFRSSGQPRLNGDGVFRSVGPARARAGSSTAPSRPASARRRRHL